MVKYDSLETLKTKNRKTRNFRKFILRNFFLVSFIFIYFLRKLEMYYEQKCSTFGQCFCCRYFKFKSKDFTYADINPICGFASVNLNSWPCVLHTILLLYARIQSFIFPRQINGTMK